MDAPGSEPPRLAGGVLVVGPLPPPVMGPSLQTPLVLDALREAGARVYHVDTRDERTVHNVGILDVRNAALGLLHAARVWRAAGLAGVDLVFVPISQGRWGYVRDAVLLAIARLRGRRSLVQLHGANFQDFYAASTAPERAMIRRTLGWQELAVACTDGLRRVFDGLVDPGRVRVLENGIADPFPGGVAAAREARSARAEADPATMRLLLIANDFAIKGAYTAIAAMAEPGLERCELRIAGAASPALVARAEAQIAELGLGERVVLLGEIGPGEKAAELAAADAFVYPTDNDAQPLVVIEALAAGLPIVTSTFGGVPDTVGEAALLVPPGDPAAVAARVRELVAEPAARLRLGDAARERFLAAYTLDAHREAVARLFGELL